VLKKDQPIFVLSDYRSGSTLTQRILNVIDDVYIYGEHYRCLDDISISFNKLLSIEFNPVKIVDKEWLNTKTRLPNCKADVQWWTSRTFLSDTLKEKCKDFICELFNPNKEDIHWGFKQPCYRLIFLEFMVEMFPEGKFIILIRNSVDTLKSAYDIWSHGKPFNIKSAHYWNELYQDYYEFLMKYPDNAFILKYEKIEKLLLELHTFLNVEMPYEKFREKLDEKIKFKPPSTKKVLISDADILDIENITKDVKKLYGY